MGKIVGYATVGMVLALAKKMAVKYGALGISDVRTTPDGSDLIFIMSDGSQHRVELNFSANGVDYDDSVTKFNVSNVQAAIEALFSELEAKQNTLTAGNGISIENDTISVTDAGGLTVLKKSDFPLSADLLAKVKANPQNYCIEYGSKYCYYVKQKTIGYSENLLYVSIANQENVGNYVIGLYGYLYIDLSNGDIGMSNSDITFARLGKETFILDNASLREYQVKAVQDTTDQTVKTGTQIRKAITIRKWH